MTRTRKIGAAAVVVLIIYFVGAVVRNHYGVLVVVHNGTQSDLKHVSVVVEPQHQSLAISVLAPGASKRFWITPTTESHVALEWLTTNGEKKSEIIGGYLEAGYCGTIRVDVMPSGVKNKEDVDPVLCWSSWWDFL